VPWDGRKFRHSNDGSEKWIRSTPAGGVELYQERPDPIAGVVTTTYPGRWVTPGFFTCEMNDGVWIAELGALGWGTGFKRCTGDAANRRANAASDAYVRQIRPNKARERWA